MSRISAFPTGPEVGNRFTKVTALEATNEVNSQVSTKNAIKRINEIRSSYDAFSEEGQRIGKSIKSMEELLASKAKGNAEELRSTIDKGIKGVMENTSKAVSQKTTIIDARNQMSQAETGKGGNVDTQA